MFVNFTHETTKNRNLNIDFGEKYGAIIVIISLGVAFAVTGLLYFKTRDSRELTVIQRRVLATLRFLSVFLMAVMLSSPLVKTLRKIIQPPLVVLAVDNSSSMPGMTDSVTAKQTLLNTLQALQNELDKNFEVVNYTFGQQVTRNGRVTFSEKRSDYSQLLHAVFNDHFNDNIGAVVLVGDGIHNQGENPLNAASELSYPVYSLAFGDTTQIRDARITAVRANKTAFWGNQFPVEIDLQFNQLDKQNLQFSISCNGSKIYSESVSPAGDDYFQTIPVTLDATAKGLQHYTATIATVAGERNVSNNTFSFVIQVLESKQKILILSPGVHPDVGAIKHALETQVNYEVTAVTSEPFPDNLEDFNLVVLNQIPTTSGSGRQLVERAVKNRLPLLLLVGNQTFLPQFNLLGLGLEIVPQAGNFEEAQPLFNEQFATFTLSNDLKESFAKYPPVQAPFASYSLDPAYQVLLYQRIKNIATNRPLIAVANRDRQKTGVIFGEGIWRWRLYNYLANNRPNEFNELVDKLVQYLAIRQNDDNFVVDYSRVYHETENVTMTAEVYNDAFELITTPEVTLVLTDAKGREYRYTFDRHSRNYRLDAGILPAGDYRFTASVTIGNQTYTEEGNFAVMPVNIEMVENAANHRLLFQIASQTGGQFFSAGEAEKLAEALKANTRIKTVSYFQTVLNEILNLRWIFFVILLLLGTEWFFRKFWGIY